jgi:YVTN family beta-propeller protein
VREHRAASVAALFAVVLTLPTIVGFGSTATVPVSAVRGSWMATEQFLVAPHSEGTGRGALVASGVHPPRDLAPQRPYSRGSAFGGLAFSVANVTVGHFPQNATFDPADGLVYVANSYSDNVSVRNRTTVAGSVNVGDLPAAITYDRADGAVDVLNQLSANVSVRNGSGLVATVPVGNSSNQAYNPEGMAYDPANGLVYVPNTNPGTVSVLNGSTVVATLVVGSSPTFATFDPENGFVYITDLGGSVTVLNGTTVVRIVGSGGPREFPWSDPAGSFTFRTTAIAI